MAANAGSMFQYWKRFDLQQLQVCFSLRSLCLAFRDAVKRARSGPSPVVRGSSGFFFGLFFRDSSLSLAIDSLSLIGNWSSLFDSHRSVVMALPLHTPFGFKALMRYMMCIYFFLLCPCARVVIPTCPGGNFTRVYDSVLRLNYFFFGRNEECACCPGYVGGAIVTLISCALGRVPNRSVLLIAGALHRPYVIGACEHSVVHCICDVQVFGFRAVVS